ncbi:MAG: hypothetical protein ACREET_04175 [Stellaceae bacterium]
MSVHLKIEKGHEGLTATISQRDVDGKAIGDPSVGLVASTAEARQLAKTLAQSLGLKVYGVIDKSASRLENPAKTIAKGADPDAGPTAAAEPPPWFAPGVGKSL